jgi:hypothetical protein
MPGGRGRGELRRAVVAGLALLALASCAGADGVSRTEEPAFALLRTDGAFEIRRYGPLVVAEVTRPGARSAAANSGFRTLADYIFATSRGGEAIAMTAPVTQEPAPGGWTVRFIMPAGRTIADLPPPGGDVVLRELSAARVAAVRFSGMPTDASLAENETALRGWMAAQGLAAAGPAMFAYYDPPWRLPWQRRNEVLIPLAD